jgi:hypothetical protein
VLSKFTVQQYKKNAVHVSGDFSAHHQELKNCTNSIRYMSFKEILQCSLRMIGIRRYDDSWVAGDICCNCEQLITIQMTPKSSHKFVNTLSLYIYINAYMCTYIHGTNIHTQRGKFLTFSLKVSGWNPGVHTE